VWWGKVNKPFTPEAFERLQQRAYAYLQSKEIWVSDLYVGADPKYRMKVRFINELAWHNLFVRSLFIAPPEEDLADFKPDITVIHVPRMLAVPAIDGTRSEAFIVPNLKENLILIGGTQYAGEQKKAIFSCMNYYLPQRDVLTMHCSANYGRAEGGQERDGALFFGLSGTGKTTLSADPERVLIGDDEHAWSDEGVFNLEGGCYAKVIRLSEEAEPQIWEASHTFGAVLENVVYDDETRQLKLDDDTITENTRAAYPVSYIPGCDTTGMMGHPKNIVFLTCDAFGVLPPVARLSRDQAMYHFLSGYTARVAGTEAGVTEPAATFSTCFGAPFLVLRPSVYAEMLGRKIDEHQANVWLINTGWSGGGPGQGARMKIQYTRAIVTAALTGQLDDVEYRHDATLNLDVPMTAPGVPSELLDPRSTWADRAGYDAAAQKLAEMFASNFEQFRDGVSDAVAKSGPQG
jgi:phosphoenolpyruvate carboxykinase (ATP)